MRQLKDLKQALIDYSIGANSDFSLTQEEAKLLVKELTKQLSQVEIDTQQASLLFKRKK
jgi:hypothetical protein